MSKYTWTGLGQFEADIAAGRLSAEAIQAIPTLATVSQSARRDAALAELLAGFTGMVNVKGFGAIGDGATDDTAAIVAAVAAGSGRTVYFPAGTYKVGAVGALGFGTKLVGQGYGVSTIKKATAGNVFTVEAAGVEFRHLGFDADVATDTTYGTSGAMIAYSGGVFTASDGRILNVYSTNIDTVIQFGPDGGARHQVIGGYWIPYTTTAGSEGLIYRTGVGGPDTGARFRSVTALTTDGQIDETGSIDSELLGVCCRRVITTSTTTLLGVQGGIWGSLGQPVTIDGENTRVVGIRVSGDITLAATMTGSCSFIGNTQTSGTFTDSSPSGTCLVLHQPLSSGYANVNKFTVSQSVNPEVILSRRVSTNSGDAAVTLTLDQSATLVRFNTAITADRAVTLPAAGRDGYTYRVVRQASATGGFNVNVGTGPLVALTAAKTWCEVTWDGPAAAWILTAYGTLP